MDREKVMTWLEICGKNNDCSGCCPYSENGFGEYGRCRESLMADAYDLLKEQEAELSYRDAKKITHNATKLDDATCPSCGNVVGEKQIWEGRKIFIQWKYCIFCGQKLDWEGR